MEGGNKKEEVTSILPAEGQRPHARMSISQKYFPLPILGKNSNLQ